ncbi:unnamed protein product [Anisakis simplex]|uniref:Single-stranded DNA-binding protein n=1 Tax=Anisakis simplex TaxID=6269 RepID=A0A0M3JBI2_ANISI|nr:unnamed protein product [Anisakis simplex]
MLGQDRSPREHNLEMSNAYGHHAGEPIECLSIAVELRKEQFTDANGQQVRIA